MRSRRTIALLVGLALVAGIGLLAVRFEFLQAVQDRLATSYTIGDAEFSAPGWLDWPRLTQSSAIAACDLCSSTGFPSSSITAQYGILSSDPGMAVFLDGQTNIALEPSDVNLPQIAWILQWPVSDFCRDYGPAPHSRKCSSYELVDDATGWALDAGQNLTP